MFGIHSQNVLYFSTAVVCIIVPWRGSEERSEILQHVISTCFLLGCHFKSQRTSHVTIVSEFSSLT